MRTRRSRAMAYGPAAGWAPRESAAATPTAAPAMIHRPRRSRTAPRGCGPGAMGGGGFGRRNWRRLRTVSLRKTTVPNKATRDRSRPPVHPGEILREDILPALNMPVQTAAKHLGVTHQTLHRILAETLAVSPAMALRLGKFRGNGP